MAVYNQRGTAERWIKEGKGAIKWTRLSCGLFIANAARLRLHALAYNLGNFLRTLATPEAIKDWSLTSLREKVIKIGAKVVSHGRDVAFRMAEVAIPRRLFPDILRLIAQLRSPPACVPTRDVRRLYVRRHMTGEVRPDEHENRLPGAWRLKNTPIVRTRGHAKRRPLHSSWESDNRESKSLAIWGISVEPKICVRCVAT